MCFGCNERSEAVFVLALQKVLLRVLYTNKILELVRTVKNYLVRGKEDKK